MPAPFMCGPSLTLGARPHFPHETVAVRVPESPCIPRFRIASQAMILAHITQTELPDLILLVGVGFIVGFATAVAALRSRRRN